jgi:hypothetical protein
MHNETGWNEKASLPAGTVKSARWLLVLAVGATVQVLNTDSPAY